MTTSCSVHKKRKAQQIHEHVKEVYVPPTVSSKSDKEYTVAQFQPFAVDRLDGFYEVVAYSTPYPFTDVVLGEHALVSKSEIKKATANMDMYQRYPVVSIELSDQGARLFEKATAENIGKPIAIVIGGKWFRCPQ